MSDKTRYSEPTTQKPPSIPVTKALLVAIILVFILMLIVGHGNVDQVATLFGDEERDLIFAGEWQRLITPIFLHGGYMHIALNALSLWWIGRQIEQIYGSRKYFIIFMLTGILGNVVSCFREPYPSLGASGALFGLLGAGLTFPTRFRSLMDDQAREVFQKRVFVVVIVNLGFSFLPGIDMWAHFGGVIGGALLGLVLLPDVLDDRPYNKVREALLTLFAGLVLAITLLAAIVQVREAYAVLHAPNVLTYSPEGKSGWWSFQLPADWKTGTGKNSGEFIAMGPSGLMLKVYTGGKRLLNGGQALLAQAGVKPTAAILSGQPAETAVIPTHTGTALFCMALPYKMRTLLFLMDVPKNALKEGEKAFRALQLSVHFDHAPPTKIP